MPFRDGSGPRGDGRLGRGLGPCADGGAGRGGRGGRGRRGLGLGRSGGAVGSADPSLTSALTNRVRELEAEVRRLSGRQAPAPQDDATE